MTRRLVLLLLSVQEPPADEPVDADEDQVQEADSIDVVAVVLADDVDQTGGRDCFAIVFVIDIFSNESSSAGRPRTTKPRHISSASARIKPASARVK